MKVKKYLILVIFSLNFHSVIYSSSADTTYIIDNIYNFDFNQASERLSRLSEMEPLRCKALNLEGKWWMAMEKEGDGRFSDFLTTLDKLEKDKQSELSIIISSTYRMRFYACTNRKYMVPILFMKVQYQLEKVDESQLKIANSEDQELFVLYKSFLSLIQDSYSVYGIFKGSDERQRIIGNIENLIRNGSYSNRTLGRYFLMKYYLDIENDRPKALAYLTELHKQYPKNLIFSQLLTNK